MKRIIYFSLFFLISFNSYSQVGKTYYNFLYKVEEEDTFASILRQFVKDDAVIYKNTPLVGKIMKNNPLIKDWANLKPGAILTLYISDDLIDMDKYNKSSIQKRGKNQELKKIIIAKNSELEGVKGSIYYMASLGDFTQISATGTKINYIQNSLATLGLQGNYFPRGSLYSYSSGLYYSKFSAVKTALPPNTIDLPPEIGVNFYGEYLWKKTNITFHTGLDYEKFSTFNINGIEEDERIYLDRLSVIYLTAGASYVLNVFNLPLYSKVSLSKSVSSNTTSEYNSTVKPDSLTGSKVLFYLNYKITDKIFLHSMFKLHKMSGPSELSSTRIGIGVGYILF